MAKNPSREPARLKWDDRACEIRITRVDGTSRLVYRARGWTEALGRDIEAARKVRSAELVRHLTRDQYRKIRNDELLRRRSGVAPAAGPVPRWPRTEPAPEASADRPTILLLKGTTGYFDFVAEVNRKTLTPKAALFRLAFREWCERNGHGSPPPL